MAIHNMKYDFNFKANIDPEEMFDRLAKKLSEIEKDGCDDVYFLECSYDGMAAIIEVEADKKAIEVCVAEFVIELLKSEEEEDSAESADNEDDSEADESDSENSEEEEEEHETKTCCVYPALPFTLVRPDSGVSDDDYKEASLLFELMTTKINDLAFDEPEDVIGLTEDILQLDDMIKARGCHYDGYGQSLFDLTRELCKEVGKRTK